MAKAKIDGISLKIGQKSIKLSLDEAIALSSELNKLLGKPEKIFVDRTVYPYLQPIVIEKPVYPSYPQVWCTTTGNLSVSEASASTSIADFGSYNGASVTYTA